MVRKTAHREFSLEWGIAFALKYLVKLAFCEKEGRITAVCNSKKTLVYDTTSCSLKGIHEF
jgi:hypothetical protein